MDCPLLKRFWYKSLSDGKVLDAGVRVAFEQLAGVSKPAARSLGENSEVLCKLGLCEG